MTLSYFLWMLGLAGAIALATYARTRLEGAANPLPNFAASINGAALRALLARFDWRWAVPMCLALAYFPLPGWLFALLVIAVLVFLVVASKRVRVDFSTGRIDWNARRMGSGPPNDLRP
jgi:hypothetical protein